KGAGKAMRWPRAEDATHYYMMGMDLDLNVAMRHATRETVDFLQEQFGLSPADAYALASIAVDFRVAEAVDSVQMIYGMIPKKLFKKNPEYWARQRRLALPPGRARLATRPSLTGSSLTLKTMGSVAVAVL